MAMATAMMMNASSGFHSSQLNINININTRRSNFSINSKAKAKAKAKANDNDNVNGGRRIWRRRKLTKKDEMIRYAEQRSPFVEEQVRDIWETGKLVGYDIERLKLWEDNIFAFVNNLAAEANQLVEQNKDEYGGKKKAILHAISNRMNEMGFYRPEAYMRTDPFKHITTPNYDHDHDQDQHQDDN